MTCVHGAREKTSYAGPFGETLGAVDGLPLNDILTCTLLASVAVDDGRVFFVFGPL